MISRLIQYIDAPPSSKNTSSLRNALWLYTLGVVVCIAFSYGARTLTKALLSILSTLLAGGI